MENNSEPVWIMFITDTETRDKLLKYGSGSQWEVDASTAAAMILVGAAGRMPSPGEDRPVRGARGVSRREGAGAPSDPEIRGDNRLQVPGGPAVNRLDASI